MTHLTSDMLTALKGVEKAIADALNRPNQMMYWQDRERLERQLGALRAVIDMATGDEPEAAAPANSDPLHGLRMDSADMGEC